VFLGQYRHQLDAKGRVAVPAQFRRGLGTGSVIAFGPERRLVIWPADEWEGVAQSHRRTASTPAEERQYIRQLYATAREVELDAQGRILLTPEQRTFAQIGERAVFVGVGSCVEVAGEEIWDGETAALSAEAFTELHDRVQTARTPEVPQ
jgi:MraZ protein